MRANITIASLLLVSQCAIAGPNIEPGDLALRHDIQRLADRGLISGPVSTWPLAWGPILEDLRAVDVSALPPGLADSVVRLRLRADWETRIGELTMHARAGAAERPTRIRSFQNTPRGNVDVAVGGSWIGEWLSVDLNVQVVDSDQDTQEIRSDNSAIGVILGNWSIAASTLEQWWGPSWDGSLILSNNARPLPSVTIDRVFNDAFETKWLSWLGPWDMNIRFGQFEGDRTIPNAQFFGMRLNFRPSRSFEFGLSRTAQWCGDGRPCGLDTFADLFLGRDNRGDAGIDTANEPGNQLAGVDFRWLPSFLVKNVAVYGQFVGEDEAGGFPSRWMGQAGVEWSGYVGDRWSTRVYGEVSATSCQFYESSEAFNCAYNHGIYQTGYRYRGRSVGHGADNDARLVSIGLIMVDAAGTQWAALARYGGLNRGGAADPRNTLTPLRQDLSSLDVSYSHAMSFGTVDIGVGYERTDNVASGVDNSESRLYLQWRSAF